MTTLNLRRRFTRAAVLPARLMSCPFLRPARVLSVASAGALMMIGVGATPVCERASSRPDAGKAWFDAKSLCVFRLGDRQMPQDREQLSDGLLAGWRRSIDLPDPSRAVTLEGGAYPSIQTLRIDLSDGELKSGRKKDKIKLSNRVEETLAVSHLEVRGEPLLLQKAKLNMSIVADAAQLELERDRKGRPVMALADARSGSLRFDVAQADVQDLLLKNAREMGGKYGVKVESTRLTLTPETPRSIRASLHLSTKVGFIPAGMLFKAHVVVDDAMNAKITGLTVDGDEALGPLIVTLLRPALAKYNDTTRPLVSFPAGSLKLRDVSVRVDDSLHLSAAFGS